MLLFVEPEAELGRERSSGGEEPKAGTDSFEPDLPSGEEGGGGEEGIVMVGDNDTLSMRCDAALNSQEGRE